MDKRPVYLAVLMAGLLLAGVGCIGVKPTAAPETAAPSSPQAEQPAVSDEAAVPAETSQPAATETESAAKTPEQEQLEKIAQMMQQAQAGTFAVDPVPSGPATLLAADKVLSVEAKKWSDDAVPTYMRMVAGTDMPDNAFEDGAIEDGTGSFIEVLYSSASKPGKCYRLLMGFQGGVLIYNGPPTMTTGEVDCAGLIYESNSIQNLTIDSPAVMAQAVSHKKSGENISQIEVMAAGSVRSARNRICDTLASLPDDRPVYIVTSSLPYTFGSMVLKFPTGQKTDADSARLIMYDGTDNSLIGVFPFDKKSGPYYYGPYECTK